MEVKQNSLRIKGADKILVLIKPFIESSREKEWKNIKAELAGIKLTYDKLLKEHSGLHGRLFSSADIDFDADNRDAFIEDLLADAQENGAGAALAEKLWAFGRYLTVCCTTADSRPIAPYGLWCGDYKAVSSAVRYGYLQMFYNHIFAGNLSEFALSLFHTLEVNIDDLKKNSARLFGTRGIMVPCVMAPGSGLIGAIEPEVLHFTGCAAMIAQLFYEYYLFTDDMKFLSQGRCLLCRRPRFFMRSFLSRARTAHTRAALPIRPLTRPPGSETKARCMSARMRRLTFLWRRSFCKTL
jgi:alpha-L-fucosidase 2